MRGIREQLERADKLGRDDVKNFYVLDKSDGRLDGVLRFRYGNVFIDRIRERAETEGIEDELKKENTPFIDAAISKIISYFRRDKLR